MSLKRKIYHIFQFFYKISGAKQKKDNYFNIEDFCRSISPLHYWPKNFKKQERSQFFADCLTGVELETHAFCNRKCSFCPNSRLNRSDKSQIMPKELFERIIDELVEINFKKTLKLHRYNEPLAHEIIYTRIKYARRQLPNANIGFHTNGDYLNINNLRKLERMGINFIEVALYMDFEDLRNNEVDAAKKHCESFIKRIGARAIPINQKKDLARYKIMMDKLKCSIYVPNVNCQFTDRGGAIRKYSNKIRLSPCRIPFNQLFIDWTGEVLPCCHLLGDIESHRKYILGNVKQNSLQDIFFSNISNSLRKHLSNFKPKTEVCRTCSYKSYIYSKSADKLMDNAFRSMLIKYDINPSVSQKNRSANMNDKGDMI